MRDRLVAALASVVLLLVLPVRGFDASAGKPNFIVMIMDDMGWGDLGCYGNPARETPNLDQMAAEGMLFTDFYTASAICSPSRASLLSGRLPVRNGFYSTQKARNSYTPQEVVGGIASSEVLFSEMLQKNGYRNKIIGKWHLGHRPQYLPLQHGFDEWFGAPNCHYKYDNKYIPNIPVFRDDHMTGRYYEDYEINDVTGVSNLTQIYIQEALNFIEAQASKKQPFLLYWTPDATHTPLYASAKFRGKSKRGLYGDAVMELDYGVGSILNKLKQLKIDGNTFVFFSSDNGAATYAFTEGGSNGPFLCGKQTTFEGGMREPAIAWWPGKIKHSQLSSQVATLMDIYPTLMQLADISLPKGVFFDGQSLVATLLNASEYVRPIFYYRGDMLFNLRYGDFKAHFYTWDTPKESQDIGYHYCPGQHVEGVTTENFTDYSHRPLLFHLGRDPGEKFIIEFNSVEYREAITVIDRVLGEHKRTLEFGEPQLDWCDLAVQNWSPPGCEKIDRCKPAPMSRPYRCFWPY